VTWIRADLSRPESDWPLPAAFDAVLYGAQSDGYRDFPARAADMFAVNLQAVMRLLEEARRRGARQFVLLSSANVYRQSAAVIPEEGVVEPSTFYARTKRAAEMLVESYASDMSATVVRPFTVYGPGQRADTLMASLIDRVRRDQPVQVSGARGLLLTPAYVGDVVAALQQLLERDARRAFDVFNLGGDEVVDLRALAAHIGAVVGRAPRYEHRDGPDGEGWAADSSAVKRTIGWSPRVCLREGLRLSADDAGPIARE